MKFEERNKKKKKSPFLFPWQLRQSLPCRFRFFLAYLVPLNVDVTGNITAKLCEVWSEFNICCTLFTMATAAILNFYNPSPKSCHTLRWIFLQSFMKFDERNPKKIRSGDIIIKTKVILPQAQVTLAILFRPFGDVIAPKNLFGFQIFWL